MSLGKLFEKVSTSEFLTDIYIGHCLISRVKIMNNVLNRITLYSMYILANLDYYWVKCNPIVTVNGKYTFLYRINILWHK